MLGARPRSVLEPIAAGVPDHVPDPLVQARKATCIPHSFPIWQACPTRSSKRAQLAHSFLIWQAPYALVHPHSLLTWQAPDALHPAQLPYMADARRAASCTASCSSDSGWPSVATIAKAISRPRRPLLFPANGLVFFLRPLARLGWTVVLLPLPLPNSWLQLLLLVLAGLMLPLEPPPETGP